MYLRQGHNKIALPRDFSNIHFDRCRFLTHISTTMAQTLELPDGRKVDYLISGSADGFPLVYIHGTPGSYSTESDLVAACEKKNIKLITLSRAGYGGSSRNRGRTVVDFVADIHALLQYLGLNECVVGGESGGGASEYFTALAGSLTARR